MRNALLITVLLVFLAEPTLGLTFDAQAVRLELQSDFSESFDEFIEARDNDLVDIRLVAFLNASGTGNGSSSVNAYAQIWGLKENNNWVLVDQTDTEFQTLQRNEERNFVWSNAFIVSDQFEEYRVDGFVKASGENNYEKESGHITNVRPAVRCQDIEIRGRSLVAEENNSQTYTFDIRNGGEEAFVGIFSFSETSGDLSIDVLDAPGTIEPNESKTLRFRVNTRNVDHSTTVPVILHLSGRFNEKICSSADIGSESFSIRIDNIDDTLKGDCEDIKVQTFSAIVPQNTSVLKGFFISNQNNDRFLVQEIHVQAPASGFSVFNETVSPSISAFGYASGFVRIISNAVSGTQTGDVSIQVRGEFQDGPNCGFDRIQKGIFPVSIEPIARAASCSELKHEVLTVRMGENDVKEFVYRLQNNSGSRFDIDEVEVSENDSDFFVQKLFVPASVGANQAVEIRLRAETSDLSQNEKATSATVRVRGEFQNGLDCGLSDVVSPIFFELSQSLTEFDNDKSDAFCSDIEIRTRDVALLGGESISEEFSIENHSNDPFFVDGIDAFDYSEGIIVEPGFFDGFVRGNGEAALHVGISADSTSSTRNVFGFVNVRGHFNEDRTCSFNSIGREPFSIQIKPGNVTTPMQSACNQVQVSVPPNVTGSNATVSFSVQNPTNKPGVVVLRGTGLTVSPNSFSIPAHSNQTFSASVQNNTQTSTKLEYQVFSENCQSVIYYSTIVAQTVGGLGGTIRIVQAPASLVFSEKTTLSVTIQNNSSQNATITTRFQGFPSNWLSDELSLQFAAFETKTVFLDIFSNNHFGVYDGQIVVEGAGQRVQSPLQLRALQVLGLGNGFSIQTTVKQSTDNQFEIKTSIQNNESQQAQGTIFLETDTGASIQQNRIIVNPNTIQTVVFFYRPTRGLDSQTVQVRTVLDDGRTDLRSVALEPAVPDDFGFGTFLVLLGADSMTWVLAFVLLLLILTAIATAKPKPLHAPLTAASRPPVVIEKKVTEHSQTPMVTRTESRFWFLRS